MADERVAPPPGVASLSARQLAELLRGLQGRPSQALTLRVLEGRSRADCAAFFGISPAAFDIMLLRAVQALELAAWPDVAAPPRRTDEERLQAEQLAHALEPGEPRAEAELAPEVKRHARVLHHLRTLAGLVRAELDALDRATEASPRARWQLWGRRLLVLLLIAAAVYLYRRQQALAPEPPRPRPAPSRPRPPAHEERTSHETPARAAPRAPAPGLP